MPLRSTIAASRLIEVAPGACHRNALLQQEPTRIQQSVRAEIYMWLFAIVTASKPQSVKICAIAGGCRPCG